MESSAMTNQTAVTRMANEMEEGRENDNFNPTSSEQVNEQNSRINGKRITFTSEDRAVLEREYAANPKPDPSFYSSLALRLQLPKKCIMTWYRNKRARSKEYQYPARSLETSVSCDAKKGTKMQMVDAKPPADEDLPLDLSMKKRDNVQIQNS